MSSDPNELRGRTRVWNEDHSLGITRANQPGNGPAIGTPVKMTGGISNAVDPATVRQPESAVSRSCSSRWVSGCTAASSRWSAVKAAIATLLERQIGIHIYLDAGGVRVHYRGRVWWVPESNAEEFADAVLASTTLDDIMNAMPRVAAPMVRYG